MRSLSPLALPQANVLIRYRNERRARVPDPRKTCENSRIHKPTRIVKARGPGNPSRGESPHDCRTEKRTPAHA